MINKHLFSLTLNEIKNKRWLHTIRGATGVFIKGGGGLRDDLVLDRKCICNKVLFA